MVVPPHRDGGQSQFVADGVAAARRATASLAPIMEWASGRLDQPLDAATLARKGTDVAADAGPPLRGPGRDHAAPVAHASARAGGAAAARDVERVDRTGRGAVGVHDAGDAAASLPATRRDVTGRVSAPVRAVGVIERAAVSAHHVVDRHDRHRARGSSPAPALRWSRGRRRSPPPGDPSAGSVLATRAMSAGVTFCTCADVAA